MTMPHASPRTAGLDWFAQALQDHAEQECQLRLSPLSAAWSRSPLQGSGLNDLRTIRDVVRNLLRAQGIGKNCRVELAELADVGAGAAGFDDAPHSFERPFILLDKSIYKSCRLDEALDVYCGVGLHEAGHVLYTRDGYRRMRLTSSPVRRLYLNLLEDERIEALLRQDSPGYAPFLQVVKAVILERQELGQALARFDDLPDLDKVQALFFAFIRCPHLITTPIRDWKIINGECVFASLRTLFPCGPQSEDDVARLAFRMEHYWQCLRRLYPDTSAGKSDSEREPGTVPGGGARADRLRRQRQADHEDQALVTAASPAEVVARLVAAAAERERDGGQGEAERLLQEALAVEATGAAFPVRSGRRFAIADATQVLDRLNTIQQPLSPEEARELQRREQEQRGEGGHWEWGRERRTEIVPAKADAAAGRVYASARQQVRGHVAALRGVFTVRLGERTWHENGLLQGQIDRRRLAQGPVTGRVFRRRHVQPERGMALGLLLDESGSMRSGAPSRASMALQAAVLVVESLRGLPGVELEVFAHTSCGPNDNDCLVRYLYGKRNSDPTALGGYGRGRLNYDHQAILTAARLLATHTAYPRRILLVLSDGAPNGRDYQGPAAIEATRAAVEAVRQQGIEVLNVAIADYASETIFGTPNVVKFTDLGRLVSDMRGLIARIVRRATEGQ